MSTKVLTSSVLSLLLALIGLSLYPLVIRFHLNSQYDAGQQIDTFNGVAIYYNGSVDTVEGRNLTEDGYNLGLRYQCVEFIKRYYFERYKHRMPDSYGHAKDFFDVRLEDGALNEKRGMLQFSYGSREQPQVEDLIVFSPSLLNRYGHVAIISAVTDNSIEIAQQNPGPLGASREHLPLSQREGLWYAGDTNVLGWLRLPASKDQSGSQQLQNPANEELLIIQSADNT